MVDSITQWRRVTAAVTAGACLLVALLTWLGYVSVREWQRSVEMGAEREVEEASGLLVSGLIRDMRAVERSVLSSPAMNTISLRPPYQAFNIIAGAFARYQYLESFILWRRDANSSGLLLHRRERPPVWTRPVDVQRFPLRLENDAPIARVLVDRVQVDAAQARRFSVFETTIGGSRYQVVARLFYTEDPIHELDAVLGFTVNLDWARQHYFPAQLADAPWTRRAVTDVVLKLKDQHGRTVADTGGQVATNSVRRHERTLPLMFFNPQLIAADPPPDLSQQVWVVEAAARNDSSFVAALNAGNRMLMLQVVAAMALALGVLLTVRAYRAKLRLSDLQADFVSSVTHEFKTPIATIQAAGESLAAGRVDASARHEYAGFIVQEARRLARLVDNLLTFSRVTTVAITQHSFEPIALTELVPETLQRFAIYIEERQFTVSVDIPPDLPMIEGDASAIELMLDNLIDNAIRHSRSDHQLRIRAAAKHDRVIVEVSDLGGGIAGDELPLVTKKFYRGRNARQGGTGLGLAIAKRIVTDHGGTITLSSEPGIGTTVTVSFPAVASHLIAQSDSLAHPTR